MRIFSLLSLVLSLFTITNASGRVVTWGGQNSFDVSSGNDSSSVYSQLQNGVVSIYSTSEAFAALKSDGSVITWGNESLGGDSSSVALQLSSGVSTIYSNELPDTLPQIRTLNMYSLDEIQNLSLGSATMKIINGANTLLSSEIKEKNAQGNWTDIVPISEEIPMEQNEDKKFYRFKIKDSIYETSSN